VANLLERRSDAGWGDASEMPYIVARVRSDYSDPPTDGRIQDIPRRSHQAQSLVDTLLAPDRHMIIGGTWMQLYKLAEAASEDRQPVARELAAQERGLWGDGRRSVGDRR